MDDDVVVANKPSGLLVHRGGAIEELDASGAVRARVTTTQGGVAQISFGSTPLVARVRVGLYSKRMTTLEPEG